MVPQPNAAAQAVVSGTESDSDSGLSPDHIASSSAPPPLSAIAERQRTGEDSEDDEEDTGAWRTADVPRAAGDSDIRAGYLWKKGERRKVRSYAEHTYDAIATTALTTRGCGRCSSFSPSFSSPTSLPSRYADLEAAMVRAAPRAPGVLQDFGRIPAAPAAGAARRAHVHARRAQAARQHVWGRDRNKDVLPAGRVAGRRQGLGRGHP